MSKKWGVGVGSRRHKTEQRARRGGTRTADETDAREAKAVGIERVLGGLDELRVVGEAKVVVGAEVLRARRSGETETVSRG